MPFTKSSDEESDRIATAALALLRTQPDNLLDHPHGRTFLAIERAAHDVGRRVAARLTEAALATHARDQPGHTPCPGGGSRLTRKNASSTRPTNPSSTTSRPPTASPVDAIFFPPRPERKLGERSYRPDVLAKIVETATRVKSVAQAAVLIDGWSGRTVSSRNLGRIAEEVGRELVAERDAAVDDFTHHRRKADGVDPEHELAAVFADGGRVQTREAPSGPGVHGEAWKEDKIARVQTMRSPTPASDPGPEPLTCFLQPILEPAGKTPGNPAVLGPGPADVPPPRWPPEPLVRTCVAPMRPPDDFRRMVQAEAKRRHVFTAKKRAVIADGSHENWTLRDRHFPDVVAVLDFGHAAEYRHAAAKALATPTRGCDWVRNLWQGRAAVIAELRTARDAKGHGCRTLDETHEDVDLQRAWTCLSNHRDKVDCHRYRREGLPMTSSLMESQVKEFNLRVKGSEKFWRVEHAEAMLQLIAETLREDGPTLSDRINSRPVSQFRWHIPTLAAELTQTASCTRAERPPIGHVSRTPRPRPFGGLPVKPVDDSPLGLAISPHGEIAGHLRPPIAAIDARPRHPLRPPRNWHAADRPVPHGRGASLAGPPRRRSREGGRP